MYVYAVQLERSGTLRRLWDARCARPRIVHSWNKFKRGRSAIPLVSTLWYVDITPPDQEKKIVCRWVKFSTCLGAASFPLSSQCHLQRPSAEVTQKCSFAVSWRCVWRIDRVYRHLAPIIFYAQYTLCAYWIRTIRISRTILVPNGSRSPYVNRDLLAVATQLLRLAFVWQPVRVVVRIMGIIMIDTARRCKQNFEAAWEPRN